jgi:DNA-binding CsgD family transcriptional regulator
MIVSDRERRSLARIFGLLAEDEGECEIRARIGSELLDLLRADQFASFIWDDEAQRFGAGVCIHMSADNLARYVAHFQYHDPITFALQARRHATAVSEVMPHRELMRSEFFNDFLARDGLHWGINLHGFDGAQAVGDLRVWRGRQRREFDGHDKQLLDLIEPAFIAALRRQRLRRAVEPTAVIAPGRPGPSARDSLHSLSARERAVVMAVCRGLTDKQIARELAIAPSSVRTFLQRAFDKTGVTRRAALARLASGAGLQ